MGYKVLHPGILVASLAAGIGTSYALFVYGTAEIQQRLARITRVRTKLGA